MEQEHPLAFIFKSPDRVMNLLLDAKVFDRDSWHNRAASFLSLTDIPEETKKDISKMAEIMDLVHTEAMNEAVEMFNELSLGGKILMYRMTTSEEEDDCGNPDCPVHGEMYDEDDEVYLPNVESTVTVPFHHFIDIQAKAEKFKWIMGYLDGAYEETGSEEVREFIERLYNNV